MTPEEKRRRDIDDAAVLDMDWVNFCAGITIEELQQVIDDGELYLSGKAQLDDNLWSDNLPADLRTHHQRRQEQALQVMATRKEMGF